jgi:hypothetical protein
MKNRMGPGEINVKGRFTDHVEVAPGQTRHILNCIRTVTGK